MVVHRNRRSPKIHIQAWAAFLTVFCLVGTVQVLAQGALGTQAVAASARQRAKESFWWEVPKPPAAPANAHLAVVRGAYFDKHMGASRPLDEGPRQRVARFPGGFLGPAPKSKIPLYSGEIIVEATFRNWTVYLTPSHRSIYTQLEYGIDHVVEPGPTTVQVGQDIGVLYPGGTIRLSDGRIISWWLPLYGVAQKEHPRPGHQYVLFLQYNRTLEGYSEYAHIEVRDQQVVGGFYGWYPGRIPHGTPLSSLFDLIENSVKKYKSKH